MPPNCSRIEENRFSKYLCIFLIKSVQKGKAFVGIMMISMIVFSILHRRGGKVSDFARICSLRYIHY